VKIVLFFITYLLSSCYAFAQDITPEQEIEMKRLEALISKENENLSKRPKRTFEQRRIDNLEMQTYAKSCLSKIEKTGNLNYPSEAKKKSIYGMVVIHFDVVSTGEIEAIQIKRSSGSLVLDEAAIRAVELASPCQQFPDSIKVRADKFTFEKTFTYMHEENSAMDLNDVKP